MLRERVLTDVLIPQAYKVKAVRKSDGTVLRNDTYNVSPEKYSDIMTDHVVPNYKALSAAGYIFNNPCTRIRIESTGGSGTRIAVDSGSTSTGTGAVLRYLMSIDGVSELANQIDTSPGDALLSAWANVDKTPYDFGEDLAELRETIQYLKKPLDSFYKLLKPYRRSRDSWQKKGLSRAAAHSKAWLEYRFGLSPLLRSAYNIGDALANYQKVVQPVRKTARGTHTSDFSKSDQLAKNYRTYSRAVRSRCVTRGTVLYEQPGGTLSLAASLGLRPKNIPATMWAVCPYSWLIDRFVAIDKLVNATINLFDPNIRYLMACTSQYIETVHTTNMVSDKTPNWSITQQCDDLVTRQRSYYRTPAPLNQVPLPTVSFVSVKDLVNLTDITALILQRLR